MAERGPSRVLEGGGQRRLGQLRDPASAPILLIRFNFFTQMVSPQKKTQGQQQSLGDTGAAMV